MWVCVGVYVDVCVWMGVYVCVWMITGFIPANFGCLYRV